MESELKINGIYPKNMQIVLKSFHSEKETKEIQIKNLIRSGLIIRRKHLKRKKALEMILLD